GINPFTYAATNDVNNISQPHGVGFVWCSMLWDMTWLLIDEYGFDPDFYNGTGGNNIAMQLVTEGMKIQPCGPGFIDGRDAILEADMQLYGGANQCLIWEAFAKRGLGVSASQGSANSRTDQVEAFDLPT
ncbi:MAG: M36 family metallopeptidase, partial [Saprospiraceae bacterium]|nr:M36 family metallopeptidase [Saprospiraceae bacterium]